jgi:hypothetical protein
MKEQTMDKRKKDKQCQWSAIHRKLKIEQHKLH